MTAAAPRPAHTRLPAIDPSHATIQSDLVEALNNRLSGGLALSAEAAAGGAAPAWIACDAKDGFLHLAPLLAGGAVPALTDAAGRPDAAAAAVALGAVEPVIAAIELVFGRALRPTAVVAEAPADSVFVHVKARKDGVRLHRLLLAVNPGMRLGAAGTLPLDAAAFVDVAPGWTGRITGPVVSPASLARIGTGDLLLIGTGGVVARFTPPGRDTTLAARLDVQGGTMVVEQELEVAEAAHHTRAGPGPDPHRDRAAITVPTSVEFNGGGLTLERLAALGPGSVVALPGAAGGVLPVQLRAGGRAVASGELVAVGDGYGVLITAVVSADAAEG